MAARGLARGLPWKKQRVDPLAGAGTFALRLQTHNGDKVPRNMYKDVACTLPATIEGDAIGGWKDPKTGLIATQATAGFRPLLHFELGTPTIVFDAVDDFLSLPDTGVITAAEMFLGMKNVTGGAAFGFPAFDLGGVGTDDRNSYIPFTDTNIYDSFFSSVRKTFAQGGATFTNWFVYNPLSQTGLWRAYVNNTQVTTTGVNGFVTATTNFLGKSVGGFRSMAVTSLLIGNPVADRTYVSNYVTGLNPH